MEYESAFLLFGFVVVAAYAVQTATGFGAMLVCVTFLLLTKVGGPWLGLAFGVMVLVLAARDLHHLRVASAAPEKPISGAASVTALLGAGVIHGIYAAGGPMLVYAIGREGLTKKVFRSTLSMVWILLNVILVTRFMLATNDGSGWRFWRSSSLLRSR
jgi:hypothetical protein